MLPLHPVQHDSHSHLLQLAVVVHLQDEDTLHIDLLKGLALRLWYQTKL